GVAAAPARVARAPAVTRTVRSATSRGEWTPVQIAIENSGRRRLSMRLHDHHPVAAEGSGLPFAVAPPPGARAEVAYRLRRIARGVHQFGDSETRLTSPLQLFDLPQSVPDHCLR